MRRLKEFGTSILRQASIQLVKFKVKPPPTIRENGISVTIRVKNEAEWIKYCLLSFKDFADEIIIADNGSTDGSVELINDFIADHPEIKIKFYDRSADTYLEISNFVLQETRYRWVMRVDGDFIAKTSGKYNIAKLRRRILQLDPNIYYGIRLNIILLYIDFFHTHKEIPSSKEFYLFTYSPDLHCYRKWKYSDIFFVPIYYKILEFTEPFIFHLNIKSKTKELERRYVTGWFLEGNNRPLSSYIKERIKSDFGTDSEEVAAENILKIYFEKCVPFNPTLYDGYPEILKPFIENPPYRIIYDENGKIKTRIEPK